MDKTKIPTGSLLRRLKSPFPDSYSKHILSIPEKDKNSSNKQPIQSSHEEMREAPSPIESSSKNIESISIENWSGFRELIEVVEEGESHDAWCRGLNDRFPTEADVSELLKKVEIQQFFEQTIAHIVNAYTTVEIYSDPEADTTEIYDQIFTLYDDTLNNKKGLRDAIFTEVFYKLIEQHPTKINLYLEFILRKKTNFSGEIFHGKLLIYFLDSSLVKKEKITELLKLLQCSDLVFAWNMLVAINQNFIQRQLLMKRIVAALTAMSSKEHVAQIINFLRDPSLLKELKLNEKLGLIRSFITRKNDFSRDNMVNIWNIAVEKDLLEEKDNLWNKVLHFIIHSPEEDRLAEIVYCLSGPNPLIGLTEEEKTRLIGVNISAIWNIATNLKVDTQYFNLKLQEKHVQEIKGTRNFFEKINDETKLKKEIEKYNIVDESLKWPLACEKVLKAVIESEPLISFIYFSVAKKTLSLSKQSELFLLILKKIKEDLLFKEKNFSIYFSELLKTRIDIPNFGHDLAVWMNQLDFDVSILNQLVVDATEALTQDPQAFLNFIREVELNTDIWQQLVKQFIAKNKNIDIIKYFIDGDEKNPKIDYLKIQLAEMKYSEWISLPSEKMKSDIVSIIKKQSDEIVTILPAILTQCLEEQENTTIETAITIAEIIVKDYCSVGLEKVVHEDANKGCNKTDNSSAQSIAEKIEFIIQFGLLVIFNLSAKKIDNDGRKFVHTLLWYCRQSNKTANETVHCFREIELLSAEEEENKKVIRAYFSEKLPVLFHDDKDMDPQIWANTIITTISQLSQATIFGLLSAVSDLIPCLQNILSTTCKEGAETGIYENHKMVLLFLVKKIKEDALPINHDIKKEDSLLSAEKFIRETITPTMAWEILNDPDMLYDLAEFTKVQVNLKLKKYATLYNILPIIFDIAAKEEHNNKQKIDQMVMNFLDRFSEKNLEKIQLILNALFDSKKIWNTIPEQNKNETLELRDGILTFFKENLFSQLDVDSQPVIKESDNISEIAKSIIQHLTTKKSKIKGEEGSFDIPFQTSMALYLQDKKRAAKKLAKIYNYLEKQSKKSDESVPAERGSFSFRVSFSQSILQTSLPETAEEETYCPWIRENRAGAGRLLDLLLHSDAEDIRTNSNFFKAISYGGEAYISSQELEELKTWLVEHYKKEFFDNLDLIYRNPNGAAIIASFIQNLFRKEIPGELSKPKILTKESLTIEEKCQLLMKWPDPWPSEVIDGEAYLKEALLKVEEELVKTSNTAKEQILLFDAFIQSREGAYKNDEARREQRRLLSLSEDPKLWGEMFLQLANPDFSEIEESSKEYQQIAILQKLLYPSLPLLTSEESHNFSEKQLKFIDTISNIESNIQSKIEHPFTLIQNSLFNPTKLSVGFLLLQLLDTIRGNQSLEDILYEKFKIDELDEVEVEERIFTFLTRPYILERIAETLFQELVELKLFSYHKREELAEALLIQDTSNSNIFWLLPILGSYLTNEALMRLYLREPEEVQSIIKLIFLKKDETYTDSFFNTHFAFIEQIFKSVAFPTLLENIKQLSDSGKSLAIKLLLETQNEHVNIKGYIETLSQIMDEEVITPFISFAQLNALYEKVSLNEEASLLRLKIASLLLKQKESYTQKRKEGYLETLCASVGLSKALDYFATLDNEDKSRLVERWLSIPSTIAERAKYWDIIANIPVGFLQIKETSFLYNALTAWLKEPENVQATNENTLSRLLAFLSPEDFQKIWSHHDQTHLEQDEVLQWLSIQAHDNMSSDTILNDQMHYLGHLISSCSNELALISSDIVKKYLFETSNELTWSVLEEPAEIMPTLSHEYEKLAQKQAQQKVILSKLKKAMSRERLTEILTKEGETRFLDKNELALLSEEDTPQQRLLDYHKRWLGYRKQYEKIKEMFGYLNQNDYVPFNDALARENRSLAKLKIVADAAGAYDFSRWLNKCMNTKGANQVLEEIAHSKQKDELAFLYFENDKSRAAKFIVDAQMLRLMKISASQLRRIESKFVPANKLHETLFECPELLKEKAAQRSDLLRGIRDIKQEIQDINAQESLSESDLKRKENFEKFLLVDLHNELEKNKQMVLNQLGFLDANLATFPDMNEQMIAQILNSYGEVVFNYYADDTEILDAFQRVLISLSAKYSEEILPFLFDALKTVTILPVSELSAYEVDPKKVLFISAVGGVNLIPNAEDAPEKREYCLSRSKNCEIILRAAIKAAMPNKNDTLENQKKRDDFRKLIVQYLKKDTLLHSESALLTAYLNSLSTDPSKEINSHSELMDNVKNQAVLREALSEPNMVAALGEDIHQAANQLEGANTLYRLFLTSQLLFDVSEFEKVLSFKEKIVRLIIDGEYQKANTELEGNPVTEVERKQLLTPKLQACFQRVNSQGIIIPEKEWKEALELEKDSIAFLKGRKAHLEQLQSDVLVRALQKQFYETCANNDESTLNKETIEKAKEIYATYRKKRLADYRQGFLRDKISMLAERIGGKKSDIQKGKSTLLKWISKYQHSFESRELQRKLDNHNEGIGSYVFAKNVEGKLIKIGKLGEDNQLIFTGDYLKHRLALQKATQEFNTYKAHCDRLKQTQELPIKEKNTLLALREAWKNITAEAPLFLFNTPQGISLYSESGKNIGIYRENSKEEAFLSQTIYAVDNQGKRVKVGELGLKNHFIATDERIIKQQAVNNALKDYYDYLGEISSDKAKWSVKESDTVEQLENNTRLAKEELKKILIEKGELSIRKGTRLFISHLDAWDNEGYYDETEEGQPIWKQDNAFCRSKDILQYFDVKTEEGKHLQAVIPALVQDVISEGGLANFYENELNIKNIETSTFLRQTFLNRLSTRYFYLTDQDLSCLVAHHTSEELVSLLGNFANRESSLEQAKTLLKKMLLNKTHSAYISEPKKQAGLINWFKKLNVTNEEAKEWMEFFYPTPESNKSIPDLLITHRVVQQDQESNMALLQQWNIANLPDEVITGLPAKIKEKWFEKPEYLFDIEKRWDKVVAGMNHQHLKAIVETFLLNQLDRLYFVKGIQLFDQKQQDLLLNGFLNVYKNARESSHASRDRFLKIFYESPELHAAAFVNKAQFLELFTTDNLMEGLRFCLRHAENDDLKNIFKNVLNKKYEDGTLQVHPIILRDLSNFIAQSYPEEQIASLANLFTSDSLITSIRMYLEESTDNLQLRNALYTILKTRLNNPRFKFEESHLSILNQFIAKLYLTQEEVNNLEEQLYHHTKLSVTGVYDYLPTGKALNPRRADALIQECLINHWTWNSSPEFYPDWQNFLMDYASGTMDIYSSAQSINKVDIVNATINQINNDVSQAQIFWEKILSDSDNSKWVYPYLQDEHFSDKFLAEISKTIKIFAEKGLYHKALTLYDKVPAEKRSNELRMLMDDVNFEQKLAKTIDELKNIDKDRNEKEKQLTHLRKEAFKHYYPSKGFGFMKWWYLTFGGWMKHAHVTEGRMISKYKVAPATISLEATPVTPIETAGEVEAVHIIAPLPPLPSAIVMPPVSSTPLRWNISNKIVELKDMLEQYKKNFLMAFEESTTENIIEALGNHITKMQKLARDICKILPSEKADLQQLNVILVEIHALVTEEPSRMLKEKFNYQREGLEGSWDFLPNANGSLAEDYVAWRNRAKKKLLDDRLKGLLRVVHKKLMDNRGIISSKIALFDNPFPAKNVPEPTENGQQYARIVGGLREALSNLQQFKEKGEESNFDRKINAENLLQRIKKYNFPEGLNDIREKLIQYSHEKRCIIAASELDAEINTIQEERLLGMELWKAVALYYLKNLVQNCYDNAYKQDVYRYLRSELFQLMQRFESSLLGELSAMQSETILQEIISTTQRTINDASNVSEEPTINQYREIFKGIATVEDDNIQYLKYMEACQQLRAKTGKNHPALNELNRRVIEAENLAGDFFKDEKSIQQIHQDNYINSTTSRTEIICIEAKNQKDYCGIPDELVRAYATRAGSRESKLALIAKKGKECETQAMQGVDIAGNDMLKELELEGTVEQRQICQQVAQALERKQVTPHAQVEEIEEAVEIHSENSVSKSDSLEEQETEVFKAKEIAALETLRMDTGFESPYVFFINELIKKIKAGEDLTAWHLTEEQKEKAVGTCKTDVLSTSLLSFASLRMPIVQLKEQKKRCFEEISRMHKPSVSALTEYAILSLRLALLGEATEKYEVQFVANKEAAKQMGQTNTFYCFEEEGEWKYTIDICPRSKAQQEEKMEVSGIIDAFDKHAAKEDVIQKIAQSKQGCTLVGLELQYVSIVLENKDYKWEEDLEALPHWKVHLETQYNETKALLSQENVVGLEGKMQLLAKRSIANHLAVSVLDKTLKYFPEDAISLQKREELYNEQQDIQFQFLAWKKQLENGALQGESVEIELLDDLPENKEELQENTIYLFKHEDFVKYTVVIKNEAGELNLREYNRLSKGLMTELEKKVATCLSASTTTELTEEDKKGIWRIASSTGYAPRNSSLLIEFIDRKLDTLKLLSKHKVTQVRPVTLPQKNGFFSKIPLDDSNIGFGYRRGGIGRGQ